MAFETIMSISLTVTITNVSLIVNSHFFYLFAVYPSNLQQSFLTCHKCDDWFVDSINDWKDLSSALFKMEKWDFLNIMTESGG